MKSDKEAHFDSSTASAIEAPAVCKSHEFGVVVLATLAVPLTVLSSKVLAVNSVSFLADALSLRLRTLLLAAICSALASSACVWRLLFPAVWRWISSTRAVIRPCWSAANPSLVRITSCWPVLDKEAMRWL
jgi:hypothetical protein